MNSIFVIFLVASSAVAIPAHYDNDIEDAIVAFSLMSTQKNGGDATALLNNLLPYMMNDATRLDRGTKRMLLAAGGLSTQQANRMLDEVLPQLVRENKSTYEQIMALLVASDQYCVRQDGQRCPSGEESVLPFTTMNSDRGCRQQYVETSIEITGTDMCVCDEQDDVLLWISLLDKIQKAAGPGTNSSSFISQVPNQIPVILMMLLSETPCKGTIRGTNVPCQCSTVTEGNEALLTQYIVNAPGSEDILTSSARAKIQAMASSPSTRAGELQSYVLSQQSLSPTYLPYLLGSGATTKQLLMQIILANTGMDSTTVQLFLNGGFRDSKNKIALINYMANRGLMSADAVPFILGVDNGIEFFINSMMSSGVIEPFMGALLLASKSGASQSEIFELLSQSLIGGGIDYSGYGKPYIPALPSGVFPGSKLYFAHLETLGVNTCSLHDLRNRFNCGFDGISAAQCEILPYCCYNPVFLTDDEVSNMTDGKITIAASVPWCYYNVFFIYYDSFSLSVKRPGSFASPASCLPLFKYGLNIDASIYYVYAQSSSNSALSKMINFRAECGFPGITEFHCVAIRGCCWDKYAPYRVPQCFKPNGPSVLKFDLNSIPVAYQPMNHTCNVNYFQFPVLYYRRIACMPTWDMFVAGRDPLKLPDKYECLWKLGCCWEDDEEVVRKYPKMPRCYQREDGGFSVQTNNIAQLSDLITRSGVMGSDVTSEFPPASPGH